MPLVFLTTSSQDRCRPCGGLTGSKTRSHTFSATTLLQLLAEHLIHQLRIGLTFGGFHHLADEEPEHGLLPRAILLELFGIRGNHLVDDLPQCESIRRLLRTSFLLVDFRKVFVALETEVVE